MIEALAEKEFNVTFTAKDGTDVMLRPVHLKDADDIVSGVESIIKAGQYIQKEEQRTLAEEQELIEEMRQKGNMYLAVEIEGHVVGIARVIRGDLEMKKHTGVFRIWLKETAQGKGIGKKIMEYTLTWARSHNLHKIWLTVFSENEVAHQLYKRFGFVQEGIQKDQAYLNGKYQDEIFMAHFL